MSDLNQRKERILRAMIVEYIAAAEPVGSELLAAKYELGVRSATIRNELAELAEQGYLEQPHTSAGRIPSDRGYRYYVDHMATPGKPEANVRLKLHRATDEGVLKDLLRETTKVLSRLTQLLAAAIIVTDTNLRIRNAVISALGPERMLLVVVLNNGHVENRLIECPKNLTLEDIGRVNELLGPMLGNHTVRSLSRLKAPLDRYPAPLNQLLAAVCASIRQVARDLSKASLIIEGEEFILGQPELRRDVALFQELVSTLEDEETGASALAAPADRSQAVTIGKEHLDEHLQPFTIVSQSFFVGQEEAGTLSVIGPTRMDYDSSISMLDFTAKAISETLTKLMK